MQQSTDDLFHQSVKLQQAGEYSQVVELLSPQYTEVDEADIRLTVQLAEARRRLGESPEAASLFRAAALCYAGEGMLAHAVALEQIIATLTPTEASTLPALAAAYAQAPAGADGGAPFADVFMAMSPGALEVFFSTGAQRRVKRGEVVLDGRSDDGALYALVKGEVRLFGRGDDGAWLEALRLRGGQVFDSGCLRWGDATGRIVAAFDSTLLVIPRETLDAALARNEAFNASMAAWRRALSLGQVLVSRPAFTSLDHSTRRQLSHAMEEVSFNRGTIIQREGDAVEKLYIAQSGRLERFTDGSDGRITLDELGPGGVFGEEAVTEDLPALTSVKARTDVVLLAIARDRIEGAFMAQPTALAHMREAIRERAADAIRRLTHSN